MLIWMCLISSQLFFPWSCLGVFHLSANSYRYLCSFNTKHLGTTSLSPENPQPFVRHKEAMDKPSGFLLNLTLSKQWGSYDPLILNAEFQSEELFIWPKTNKTPFRFVPILIYVSAFLHTAQNALLSLCSICFHAFLHLQFSLLYLFIRPDSKSGIWDCLTLSQLSLTSRLLNY